mgnify:CR=1 FL=1
MIKVVAINGSARPDGNTAIMIRRVLKELEREGIETELIQLAGLNIQGCCACYKCVAAKNKRCSVTSDVINDCIAKMEKADGIILGSPTYFADCTSSMKSLIDRTGFVSRANGHMFSRKVGAAVVSVRRAGAIHAFDTLNHFFTINSMIVVGSSYWNIGLGRNIGDVEQDHEGMQTMATLGINMAWLLKKVNG